MKLRTSTLVFAVLSLAALSGCATVPPKVLIQQSFEPGDKNQRVLMQASGKRNEATKTPLFNVFMSVCDVNEGSAEANCKDSVVLEDVLPGSLY